MAVMMVASEQAGVTMGMTAPLPVYMRLAVRVSVGRRAAVIILAGGLAGVCVHGPLRLRLPS